MSVVLYAAKTGIGAAKNMKTTAITKNKTKYTIFSNIRFTSIAYKFVKPIYKLYYV